MKNGLSCLVMDVGSTYTKYALISNGIMQYRRKVRSSLADFPSFFCMADQLILPVKRDIDGIALSVTAIVDSESKELINSHSMAFACEKNLAQRISERYDHLPVSISNDAKAAAYAELKDGNLRGCKNAIALIIGTGLGGAVIVEEKLLEGSHFFSGEFSSIQLYASMDVQEEQYGAYQYGYRGLYQLYQSLCMTKNTEITGEAIFTAAKQNNPQAMEAIRQYCHRLAVLIQNLQTVIDPQRVVIGGGMSVQPLLIHTIREELEKNARKHPYGVPCVEVMACKFNNEANLLGAYKLFCDMMIENA